MVWACGRMDEHRMARRVLMAEVSGGWVRGRPRLGWMDGWCEGGLRQQRNDGRSCATMRERKKRVQSPGANVTDGVSRGHFSWPCVLSDRIPVLWWL